MSNETTFSGKNYSIESTEEGQFVLVHPVSENETFDSFEELVESHPVCEEARSFFFGESDAVENSEAYNTGFEASAQGEDRTANPYAKGTWDSNAWFAGWDAQ